MEGHRWKGGRGVDWPPRGTIPKPRETYFIMLQAVDHQLGKNDHAGPAHPSTAVDHDGRVQVLGAFQHAVGVATDWLDLLQVGCKTRCKSRHWSPPVALHTSWGGREDGDFFFFLSDNNLQFLQDTNYLAVTHCTVLDPERTSWESISPWENLFFKLNSSFLKIKFCFPLCKSQSPPSRWVSTLLTAIPTINRLGSEHQLGPLETPACQSQFLVGRASICPSFLPFTERVNISWGLTPFSDFKIDFGEPGFQLGSPVVTWVAQGNGPPFLGGNVWVGGGVCHLPLCFQHLPGPAGLCKGLFNIPIGHKWKISQSKP